VNGKPLVYLDNAATSQNQIRFWKSGINIIQKLMNVHRGIHTLSQLATEEMELSRRKSRNSSMLNMILKLFLPKEQQKDSIYRLYFNPKLKKDDEIIISYLEHHSNIVPWQMLCERTGAKLRVIPIDENGILQLDYLKHF
jgi:cysteine desulfurase/selenocysteine lyase